MKIFFLSSGPILPLVGGRRLREHQMLKELAAFGPVRVLCVVKGSLEKKDESCHPMTMNEFPHPVTFSFHPLDPKSIFHPITRRFSPHFAKGFSSGLLDQLKTEVSEGDLIWASRLRMAKYISRLPGKKVFTVLDEHQIESDLLLDEAFQSWRSWARGASAIQVARYERALTKKAQLVVTASPIDANRVQKLSPKSRVKVIPFQLPLESYDPKTGKASGPVSSHAGPKKNQIVFIADLEYPPNIEAIRWVQEEVMPRLKAALPGKAPEFVVASSDPPPRHENFLVSHYETPEGLGVILAESKLAFFPLRQGRGNRIHILEAMAAGLPIVCTGKSIDGLTVRPSFDVFLANDEDGMTSHLLRLLRDENLRESMGKNARETVHRFYGNQALHQSFLDIFSGLGIKGF